MARKKLKEIKWLSDAEGHDYPAAESFLRIIYGEERVANMMIGLRNTPLAKFKAKDLFIASQLPLLGLSNFHVARVRKKIRKGASLSPLLLVRDEQNGKVVIADGYHRLCAIYEFDEDAMIQCKIV